MSNTTMITTVAASLAGMFVGAVAAEACVSPGVCSGNCCFDTFCLDNGSCVTIGGKKICCS